MQAAVVGGAFIGAACGMYRLTSSRFANPSEVLRAVVRYESSLLTPACGADLALVLGFVLGGILSKWLLAQTFEDPPPASFSLLAAGMAVGIGATLSNGCISHGITGLSSLSPRAVVAIVVLLPAAFAVSPLGVGASASSMPIVTTLDAATQERAAQLAKALAVASSPMLFLSRGTWEHNAYCGLWTGVCFSVGACLGGLVRPSVVSAALSLSAPDRSLWILLGSAFAICFSFFRVAQLAGVSDTPDPYHYMATPPPYSSPSGVKRYPNPPTHVDAATVVGGLLFGGGWALGALCPASLLVNLGAAPHARALQLFLGAFAAGVFATPPLKRAMNL